MRLLDRYLFRELFTPLAFCLVGIQSFIIFVTIFSDASKIEEARLHFGGTIEYAAAASMEYLPIVIPVALLLALLMALTHHARHNEITAMRAAGIGLWRICVPYFLVGLAGSGILFALNELVVPRSLDRAQRLLNHDEPTSGPQTEVLNFGFINAPAHRTWIVRDYYRPGAAEMPRVEVDCFLPDGSGFILDADRAAYTNGVWFFYNARESSQANGALQWETNVLAMPQFDETPREIRNYYNITTFLKDVGAHNPNIPLKDLIIFLRWHPRLTHSDESRLLTELDERMATPLTCVVVALIAIPFGAAPGRRNLFFGVAGSIFICFAYFVLQRVSLAFGAGGEWPPWLAAWLPNWFFGALGLVLTMRIR